MFLVSGTVALIYEAAWQREFTLLFGSSAPATAAVLAAYFAGLGLGSLAFGKLAKRIRNPLVVYGVLELVIAFGALLVTPILSSYAELYPRLVSRLGGEGMAFVMAKGFCAFAAVAIPTIAMGGTLPVIAQIFEARRERFGELAGWLYLLNTAGAACGVAAFPWLLGSFGMERTARWCATLNAIIGVGALLLCRAKADIIAETPRTSTRSGRRISSLVLLAFLSGFVIFVLQVGWNRAFAQVHENSIYSFSFVTAIFIAAIAVGAQLARMLLRRGFDPQRTLGAAWMPGGFLTVIAPLLFLWLTDGLRYSGGGGITSNLVIPSILVVFVPIIFLATGLPLILHRVANVSRRSAAEATGMVLAANVAGSVAGALAGGFVFPATLGLWRTIILTGTIIAGTGAFLRGGKIRAGLLVGACLLAGGLAIFLDLPRARIDLARGETLLAIEEGTHGVVAVIERSGSRRLKLNNHYVLGGTAAIGDERIQAHIPLILHGQPRRVAFLGYGTGITAGAAALHPVEQSVAVELVPEVAKLAGRFFSEASLDTEQKRSGPPPEVIIEDARNFLRGTKEHFDVIIGDLVVPWRYGEGALYTLEQFTIGRERLAEGGIYCAWLPLFQLDREDFELISRTFQAVFPYVSVWRGDFSPRERALALIGSMGDHLNSETVGRRLREIQADRFNPQLKHDRAFWMHFVGLAAANLERTKETLNTENRPLVELRRRRLEPFVGRPLQLWESELLEAGFAGLKNKLSDDALKGWEAGGLMSEFTHLIAENRPSEAALVQQKISDTLGAETTQSIFAK